MTSSGRLPGARGATTFAEGAGYGYEDHLLVLDVCVSEDFLQPVLHQQAVIVHHLHRSTTRHGYKAGVGLIREGARSRRVDIGGRGCH